MIQKVAALKSSSVSNSLNLVKEWEKPGILVFHHTSVGIGIFDFLNKSYKETQTLANRGKMSFNLVAE